MSFEISKFAMDGYSKLIKEPQKSSLQISLYGGESLINWEVVKQILAYGNNLFKNLKEINWILNTNGTLLTPEIASFLRENKVDVHISVDGSEERHNRYRVLKNGESFFELLKKSLSILRDCHYKLQFDSCLTDANLSSLKSLVDFAGMHGATRIYLALTDNLESQAIPDLSKDILADKLIEAREYGKKCGVDVSGPWATAIFKFNRRSKPRVAADVPHINIEPSGEMFLSYYPEKKLGHVQDLEKILAEGRYKNIVDQWEEEKKGCQDCNIQLSCRSYLKSMMGYHTGKILGYERECDVAKTILNRLPISYGIIRGFSKGVKIVASKYIVINKVGNDKVFFSRETRHTILKASEEFIEIFYSFSHARDPMITSKESNLSYFWSVMAILFDNKILVPEEIDEDVWFLKRHYNFSPEKRLDSKNFLGLYSTNEKFARGYIALMEKAYEELDDNLISRKKDKMVVCFCEDFRSFRSFCRSWDAPEWVGAFTIQPNFIIVRAKKDLCTPSDPRQFIMEMKHELVHLLVSDVAHNLPTWMQEGICEYFSKSYRKEDFVRFVKNKKKKIFTFSDMEIFVKNNLIDLDRSFIEDNICYKQAHSFLSYLIAYRGVDYFFSFLESIKQRDFFNSQFAKYYEPIEELEEKWFRDLFNGFGAQESMEADLYQKLVTSKNLRVIEKGDKILLYNSFSGGRMFGSKDMLELTDFISEGRSVRDIEDNYEVTDLPKILAKLYFEKIILFESQNEEKDRSSLQRNQIINGELISSLRLILSGKCNLRCSYCYVEDREDNERFMPWETAEESIDKFFSLAKKHNHKFLHVRFFGGEPLLNWSVLKQSIEHIDKIRGDIRVELLVNTNGTICTEEMAKILSRHSVTVIISIDGIKEVHDSRRFFVNGKGSFDVIDKNLDIFLKNKCIVKVDTSLGDHSYNYLKSLIDYLVEKKLKYDYAIPIGLQNITMGHEKSSNLSISVSQKVKKILDLCNYAKSKEIEVGGMIFLPYNSFTSRSKLGKYCAANGAELTVMPDSSIQPCMAVNVKLGTIKKIDDVFKTGDYFDLTQRVMNKIPECSKCEIGIFCAGGCLGDVDIVGNGILSHANSCDFEKLLFKGAIKEFFM